MTEAAATQFEWDDRLCSWIIKRTEHWIVSVTPMGFNDRVCLTSHREYPWTYTSGWCYEKNGSAFLAAYAFDPETEQAPVGFKKVAVDLRTLTD